MTLWKDKEGPLFMPSASLAQGSLNVHIGGVFFLLIFCLISANRRGCLCHCATLSESTRRLNLFQFNAEWGTQSARWKDSQESIQESGTSKVHLQYKELQDLHLRIIWSWQLCMTTQRSPSNPDHASLCVKLRANKQPPAPLIVVSLGQKVRFRWW